VESPPWNVRKHGILYFTARSSWIKWDHKSLQASHHQQLQDDSPGKEQWQEIARSLVIENTLLGD